MGSSSFVRLAEVINKHPKKRVVNMTVKPTFTDCSGTVWFTDFMLQEGMPMTGYTPQTKDGYLAKWGGDEENESCVWYNGVVYSEETIILFNLGGTSAGLGYPFVPEIRHCGEERVALPGCGRTEGILPQCPESGG